jgi:hypothetical protein
VHFEVHARSNNSETAFALFGSSAKCLANNNMMIKNIRIGHHSARQIYSVIHLFVALEDAKLAFCVVEKVGEGLWPVIEGFVKCVMVIQIPVIQRNCGRVQKTKKRR